MIEIESLSEVSNNKNTSWHKEGTLYQARDKLAKIYDDFSVFGYRTDYYSNQK